MLLRGGRLAGIVTRAEDGRPVTRAAVLVSLQVLGTFVLSLEAETDTDGRYTLDLPMPGTVTSISAERAGYRTEWAELDNERTVGAGMEVRHDLTLERGGVITGRVMGPEGALVGAEVGATNPEWYFSATTDRDGRFVLPGVPRERFVVIASLWGYSMPDRPDDPDRALEDGTAPERFVVDLTEAATAEVEIGMLPWTTVRGRVTTNDGKPAAGAVVAAAGGGPAARAEADGTFAIGPLAAGEQEITATAAGGAAAAGVTVLVPAPRRRRTR